jgi:pimeloyl-ACP methyl ester carboxylesterase
MPTLTVPGAELYHEDTGGPGPAVVFSHGLLWSGRMFEAQVAALSPSRRCVTYDHRGQGRSSPAAEWSVPIEVCYQDAVALIEGLSLGPCDFVGLSMGGFVGMRLAARRPDLVRRLVLLNTSAEAEPAENLPRYRLLSLVAGLLGVRPVAGPVAKIMFGGSFLTDPARAAERERWRRELLANRRDIVRAVRGVTEREPVLGELGRIRCPTLVIAGEEDRATVPGKAERIAAAIPGAERVVVPRAGHSSTVEEPEAVSELLARFLG